VPIERMLKGYHRFKSGIHDADRARYASLASDGQRPGAVVIACSDSRVDPAIVFCADPGDIFMIRNVANLVPPMEENGTFHGTSAALEYAVMALEVPNIVVLGHAHCGGIKAMIEGCTPARLGDHARCDDRRNPARLRAQCRLGVVGKPDHIPMDS
jgi:carbonic anhydrase